MWMQHADTRPVGYLIRYLARYPVALALAAALSAGQLATPVLAQQNRPGAQQSADAPRNPAAGGEAGGPADAGPSRKSLPAPARSDTGTLMPGPRRQLP